MNQSGFAEKGESLPVFGEELRRKSLSTTSKLSREDVIAILGEVIRYARRRLYSTRTPTVEKAIWGRILLSATDQFVKVTVQQEADEAGLAELLEKLPKRVLKRVEREVGSILVRRVVDESQ